MAAVPVAVDGALAAAQALFWAAEVHAALVVCGNRTLEYRMYLSSTSV